MSESIVSHVRESVVTGCTQRQVHLHVICQLCYRGAQIGGANQRNIYSGSLLGSPRAEINDGRLTRLLQKKERALVY